MADGKGGGGQQSGGQSGGQAGQSGSGTPAPSMPSRPANVQVGKGGGKK